MSCEKSILPFNLKNLSFSPFPSPSRSLLAAFSFSLTFSSTKTKGSPTSTLLLSQLLSHLIYRCQPFRHPLVVSLYASCKILRRRCGMQDSPFSVFFFITTHFLFRDCFDRIAFVVVHFHWMVECTYLVHILHVSRTHLAPISYTSRTYLAHFKTFTIIFKIKLLPLLVGIQFSQQDHESQVMCHNKITGTTIVFVVLWMKNEKGRKRKSKVLWKWGKMEYG